MIVILITILIAIISFIYLFSRKKEVVDDNTSPYNLKDFNNEDLTSLLDCDFIDRDLVSSNSWDQELPKSNNMKTKFSCSFAKSLVPVFCHNDEDKEIFTNLIDYLSKQNDEDLLKVSMKIIQDEKKKIEELDKLERIEELERVKELDKIEDVERIEELELEEEKRRKMEDLIRSIEEI